MARAQVEFPDQEQRNEDILGQRSKAVFWIADEAKIVGPNFQNALDFQACFVLGHPGAQVINELMLGAAGIQTERDGFRQFEQLGQRGVLQVIDRYLLRKRCLCAICLWRLHRFRLCAAAI